MTSWPADLSSGAAPVACWSAETKWVRSTAFRRRGGRDDHGTRIGDARREVAHQHPRPADPGLRILSGIGARHLTTPDRRQLRLCAIQRVPAAVPCRNGGDERCGSLDALVIGGHQAAAWRSWPICCAGCGGGRRMPPLKDWGGLPQPALLVSAGRPTPGRDLTSPVPRWRPARNGGRPGCACGLRLPRPPRTRPVPALRPLQRPGHRPLTACPVRLPIRLPAARNRRRRS
jgi:hypothetical protein